MPKEFTLKEALELGLEHQKKGNLQQAQDIYLQILRQDEENPDALHLIGLIDFQLKEYLQASRYIERAVKQKPNEPQFHFNLALALQKLPNEEKNVIKHLKKAIELDPNYEKAKTHLDKILKLDTEAKKLNQ